MLVVSSTGTYSQQWSYYDDMPHPVAGGQSVVIGSKIYVLGGYSESLQAPTDMIQEYDPFNKTWNVVGYMKEPRVGLSAAVFNDNIFYFGGIEDSSLFLESFEQFKFSGDSFGTVINENKSFNREFSSSAVIDNKLYIFGGTPNQTYDSLNLSHLSVFNFDSMFVTQEVDTVFPTAESPSRLMATVVDRDIYIFGGVSSTISNRIYKYNVDSASFTRLPYDLLVPRAGGAAVYSEISGKIYVIGGAIESENAVNTVEVFSPFDVEAGPRYETSMEIPRTDLMAVDFYGEIYILGGYNASGYVVKEIEKWSESATTNYEDSSIPYEFVLEQNYPNPFNPSTSIRFVTGKAGNIRLEIFNSLGEKIITLADEYKNPGSFSISWNAVDSHNKAVPSGVYFYRLGYENKNIVRKMTLLR
jgi:N-acetylneuraminic acid mutarotase